MPDKYDRAVCATELRIRSEIITKVNNGWRPCREYELPDMALSAVKAEIDAGHAFSPETGSDSDTSSGTVSENIADLDG